MQGTQSDQLDPKSFIKWCSSKSGSNTSGILMGLAIGSPILIGVCALCFGPIALGIIISIGILLAVMLGVGLTIVIIASINEPDSNDLGMDDLLDRLHRSIRLLNDSLEVVR